LASNFDARLHAIRKGLGVLSGMHPVVVSTEVGFRKPHGAFFDALVRETGLPRSSIVHVGDSLINDHQGAISAGLESVWLCRNGPRAAEPCLTDLATLANLLTGKNPRPAGG
jgi:putative hydrolase of the HAD superfamily